MRGQAQDFRQFQEKIIGLDTFRVYYGDSTIYMTVDQMEGFDEKANPPLLGLYATWNGNALKKNRRITIEGEKRVLNFYSADTSILKFKAQTGFVSQGFFEVRDVGEVICFAVLGERDTLTVDLSIQALDIESDFAENMIEDFIGPPDNRRDESMRYGEIDTIDGIIYDATDLIRGRRVKHWIYHQYPGAVLEINPIDEEVYVRVRQAGWLQVAGNIINTY
jgi:hypothetical protein